MIYSATNATISCKDWSSSFGGKHANGNCAATRLQFDNRRPFIMLALKNKLEYQNSDVSVFIGHQFSTLCEIVVRFGSMIPEFKM